VQHRAWQVEASVVLAGVPQGDDRPVPARSISEGGPGAVEVTARVHGLALDPDAEPLAAAGSAAGATGVALAAHWSPVAEARIGLTVERMALRAFEGEAPRGETFVALRAQLDL
jgi:phosphate-selective porin OprO/OprP